MKMKRFVPLLLTATLTATLVALVCLTRPADHSLIVPLQVRAGNNIDQEKTVEAVARQDRQPDLTEASAQSRDESVTGEFEGSMKRLMSLPPALHDTDLEARAVGMAAERIDRDLRSGNSERARSLCLRFRWSATRINALARVCQRALSSSQDKRGAIIRTHPQSLLISSSDRSAHTAAKRYLRNPYDGERLADLALRLAKTGQLSAAERLLEELLQIDLMAASRLDDALADHRGVQHHGHPLKLED